MSSHSYYQLNVSLAIDLVITPHFRISLLTTKIV